MRQQQIDETNFYCILLIFAQEQQLRFEVSQFILPNLRIRFYSRRNPKLLFYVLALGM